MNASRRLVLFVLERPDLRAYFNQALQSTPHSAIYCFDGADGFDRFLEVRPDVCLVCESTARINGAILCRLIKQHRWSRGVGVYLMSARPDDASAETLIASTGIDGVLPLPPPPEQLVGLLARPHECQLVETSEAELAAETEPVEEQLPAAAPVEVDASSFFTERRTDERVLLYVRPPQEATHWDAAVGGEQSPVDLTPDMRKPTASGQPAAPDPGSRATTGSNAPAAEPVVLQPPAGEHTPLGSSPLEAMPAPVDIADLAPAPPPSRPEPTAHGDGGEATPAEALPAVGERTPAGGRPAVEELTPVASDRETTTPGAAMTPPATPIAATDGDTSLDYSGIYPLAPDERDSASLRRAIAESQLGGRLTRRVLALYRLLDAVDYYQLLGVGNTADAQALQDAYHALALEYHPDRFFPLVPGVIKERIAALFRRINEAYSVLLRAERRQRYDELLSQRGAGPPPRLPLGEGQAPSAEGGSEAQTPVGRKYLRLAFAAMARGDLDAAHLNLSFAVGHEPDNEVLRRRLNELEREIQVPR
ncbi:MAG: DnaJ domain-containing protein [Deltaproteobacteria bacterium]|nr:DnaJ domain-containing protein [Deltaproteobacteria bacterium]